MAIGWLTCLAIAALSPAPAVAQASADTEMDSMIQAAGPFVGQFALGGVLGFAAGFAIKKVGKIVVIIVGLAFILLQVLAYYGIIEIDWAPIARVVACRSPRRSNRECLDRRSDDTVCQCCGFRRSGPGVCPRAQARLIAELATEGASRRSP